jgi:hypothetical protein
LNVYRCPICEKKLRRPVWHCGHPRKRKQGRKKRRE